MVISHQSALRATERGGISNSYRLYEFGVDAPQIVKAIDYSLDNLNVACIKLLHEIGIFNEFRQLYRKKHYHSRQLLQIQPDRLVGDLLVFFNRLQ